MAYPAAYELEDLAAVRANLFGADPAPARAPGALVVTAERGNPPPPRLTAHQIAMDFARRLIDPGGYGAAEPDLAALAQELDAD